MNGLSEVGFLDEDNTRYFKRKLEEAKQVVKQLDERVNHHSLAVALQFLIQIEVDNLTYILRHVGNE